MEEMLSHWDKMSQTTDPAERQKLMLEHRQQMMALNTALRNLTGQTGMGGPGRGMMGMGPGMMGNMMGGGMGPGMMGQMRGGMMGSEHGLSDDEKAARHGHMYRGRGGRMYQNHEVMMEAFQQLEKRVDLLQEMVEHLMQD
ncbi:MAG: hypothetical protein R3F37_07535 [Candidatus Competibacteraceae bacterium]